MSDDAAWDARTAEDALLLDMRAERLRALPAAQETEAPSWAAELPIGQETYALPLESLRGCVPLRLVTPASSAHSWCACRSCASSSTIWHVLAGR